MFATDRDLVVLEPRLFDDVAWSAQHLLTTAAAAVGPDGDRIVITDHDLEKLAITAGHVVLVDGVAAEVTERLGAATLAVSRVRAAIDDPIIPLSAAGSVAGAVVRTFAPQLGVVHGELAAALGLSLAEAAAAEPTPATRFAEALGALHLIFASASAVVGDGSLLWVKAQMYRERFGRQRGRVRVAIDADGDGVAESVRQLSTSRLVRA